MAKLETPSVKTNQVIELSKEASLDSVSGVASRIAQAVRDGAEANTMIVSATPPPFVTYGTNPQKLSLADHGAQAVPLDTYVAHAAGTCSMQDLRVEKADGIIDTVSAERTLRIKINTPVVSVGKTATKEDIFSEAFKPYAENDVHPANYVVLAKPGSGHSMDNTLKTNSAFDAIAA